MSGESQDFVNKGPQELVWKPCFNTKVLVITHNSEDAQSVQDWINNEFDFAPLMATSIYADLNQFQMDLALKMFFYSPPLTKESGECGIDLKYIRWLNM